MGCTACGQKYRNPNRTKVRSTGSSRGRPFVRKIRDRTNPVQPSVPTAESVSNTSDNSNES